MLLSSSLSPSAIFRHSVRCPLRRCFSSVTTSNESVPLHHYDLPARSEPVTSTIISSHGLLGSGNNWRSILTKPQINQQRQIILTDLRNHGQSTHSNQNSIVSMANDIIELTKQVRQNSPIVLLGHSLGGKMSMMASLIQPPKFQALIVADIAPYDYSSHSHQEWSGVSHIVTSLSKLNLKNITSRDEADQLLKPSIPDSSMRSFVLANLIQSNDNSSQKFHWRINLPVLQSSLPELAKFSPPANVGPNRDIPALFIAGADSQFIREAQHDSIYQWFPNAEIVVIERARHWIHADQPARTSEAINNFLIKHGL